jgi:hypothetical protein
MSLSPLKQQHAHGREISPRNNFVQIALSMCQSGRLHYASPTSCRLHKPFVAPGEDEWWHLNLTDYVLPATKLVGQCKLSAEPRLAIATILAIDAYLCHAAVAKSTHRTIATMMSSIAKYWEWGRLNGIYQPEDWTAAHFRRLEKQLSKGRWAEALQAERRVHEFLNQQPDPVAIAFIDSRFSIRSNLSALIGTNMSAQELACARHAIHKYVEPHPSKGSWAKNSPVSQPRISWLAQAFWAANLIGNVPSPYSFKITPFPEPLARAKKLAQPHARTPTLSVDQAIGLLVYSLKYVEEYSQIICELIKEVGRIASDILKSGKISVNDRLDTMTLKWEQSDVRIRAEHLLNMEISPMSKAGPSKVTVHRLIEMLMSSCVVLIAGLNARRKDEIIHKTLGLHRKSIIPINEQLDIYEGTFYIEKTLKSYAPYFVNRATFDAYRVLQALEQAQLAFERMLSDDQRSNESLNHSMFWIRRWAPTTGKLNARTWFNFTFDTRGAGRTLTTAALGEGIPLAGGGAHVFRRFYAIIYFYRFEHGGLLAIRFQLAHLNCEMTKQYVTSAMIEAVESRIPIELRRPQEAVRTSMDTEWRELDEEIRKVGSEKLFHKIEELLDGQTFSGGFARLVERLHRKLLSDIDYSSMDRDRQARRLHQRVIARGHALRPLAHADCAAGTSRARGAKCSNTKGSGPTPENASPKVCSGCPYSWTSVGHLNGLKLDLQVLEHDVSTAPLGSLLWERRVASRDNLQSAIWLHEKRINEA